MATINVRLGEGDARLVRELKRRGVSISSLVRDALRGEAQRTRMRGLLDVDTLTSEMMKRYPTPDAVAAHRVDVTDRRQVQRAIAKKLRSGR